MAEELEIKLTLAPGSGDAVRAWMQSLLAELPPPMRLVNRYFDTPEQSLNAQRAALRIRQADAAYIQTLKTQGEFVDGAHRRQEWEWPIPGPHLNIGLLADTALGDRINLAALDVVFETNFDRQCALLETAEASVECALDLGFVLSGDHTRELAEVEFELKSGNSAALLAWARELAGRVPLFLNLVSKAEQGYWLAGLGEPESQHEGDDPVTALLRALSVYWLTGGAEAAVLASVSGARETAKRAGVASQLDWVEKQLKAAPTTSWLFEPELLQLQLGLLAAH